MNKLVTVSVATFLALSLYGMSRNNNVNKGTISVPNFGVSQTTNSVGPVAPELKEVSKLELNDSQVVFISGPIGEESAGVASEILELAANHKPIYLLIDSPGGSVLDGARILSAIEAANVPVYTVCTGICASMAFIIHQHGTERLALDRSILMAHPASGGVQGTLEQMQSRLGTIKRYVDKMSVRIAARAGLTLEQYQAMTVSELWLDAEDATAKKFNDKIVSVYLKGKQLKIPLVSDQVEPGEEPKFNLDWK